MMLRLLRDLVAACAVSALFIGGLGTVFVISSADAVYAKHGKGDGKGKGGGRKGGDGDKGDRKGGDRDKGERHGKKGKDGKHGRDHAGGKHHGKHDGWHGKRHGKHHGWHGKKHGKHKGWHGKKYGKSYKGWNGRDRRDYDRWGNDFVAAFERDIRRAFGRDDRRSRFEGSRNGVRPQQRVRPVERSLRPRSRRDPLVASITSPFGSDKLRNLNAAKASPVAFRNASPNSNVGKIASYQASATEYYENRERLQRRQERLKSLDENYTGRSSNEVLGDIANLDPNSETFEQDFNALEQELNDAETYEARRDRLRSGIKEAKKDTAESLKQAEADFFDASKGREVTKQTLSQLHRILGLPKPSTRPKNDESPEQLAASN